MGEGGREGGRECKGDSREREHHLVLHLSFVVL